MGLKVKRKGSKPAESVPNGRRVPHPGKTRTESFKQVLRKLFNDNGAKAKVGATKNDLLELAIEKAKRGNFFFWNALISLHEKEACTEDDLAEFTERIYSIVRRAVEKLEGGREALAEIARQLKKEEI